MPSTKPLPATDSAAELNQIIGEDSTATFENDPKFIDSNPTANASTESLRAAKDDDEEDDVNGNLQDDVDDSLEEDDEEESDEDTEDDESDADDEDEDDDDDEFEDDDDEEDEDDDEEEDGEEEVTAAPALRADGLLGYEDEAEDVASNRDRTQGDAARAKAEEADDDGGDLDEGVDGEDDDVDDLDTDRVSSVPVIPSSSHHPATQLGI